jgi:hypothetical protein
LSRFWLNLDKLNFKLKLKTSFLQVRILLSAIKSLICGDGETVNANALSIETIKLNLFQEVENIG